MTSGLAIALFVVALLGAIMVHEWGHFASARRFGMKADRFFVGFGPTLWSTRRGETEYGVKALPLGGFVRICGMSPVDERDPAVLDAVFPAGRPVPDEPWGELERELRGRGTPKQTTERIVRRTRATVESEVDPGEIRDVLREVIITEVEDTGRHGDLRHRLLLGDRGRFFHDRPAWQRAVVLVAGSSMHFVLAVVALVAAAAFLPQWTGDLDTRVAAVIEDSPAEAAGLERGDRVLQVADVRSDDYQVLRDEIRARPGEELTVVVGRDGEEVALSMVPEPTEDPQTGEVFGTVGFAPDLELVRVGPVQAIQQALVGEPAPGRVVGFVPMFVGSIEGILNVFSPSGLADILAQAAGQQERDAEGAVSIVGAASIAGQAADGPLGILAFVSLFALINVFIGIFNLVPLPPLDGGHLAVLGVEQTVNAVRRLRGKAADFVVDPRVFAAIAIPVIAGLLVLMGVLIWLDITDPIRLS